jgi:hypothetical protein
MALILQITHPLNRCVDERNMEEERPMIEIFRKHLTFFLVTLALGLSGCGEQDHEDSVVLARINNFNLTLDEYEYQLSEELELDSDFKVTQEAKRKFLEEIIRKELLVQEAKKRDLDRKEEFVKTIQRYWESTLIRNLLNVKGEEISSKIYVSEEDIKNRYDKLVRFDSSLGPLSEARELIMEDLKEEKKTAMLESWIRGLREKASVKIEEELL